EECLRKSGIRLPFNWRTAEVWATQLTRAVPVKPRRTAPTTSGWLRYVRNKSVLFVDSRRFQSHDLRYDPPYPGDNSFFLKSVSRRDPARSRISALTSRNRAALLTGPPGVLTFFSMWARGYPIEECAHTAVSSPALRTKILELVSVLHLGAGE